MGNASKNEKKTASAGSEERVRSSLKARTHDRGRRRTAQCDVEVTEEDRRVEEGDLEGDGERLVEQRARRLAGTEDLCARAKRLITGEAAQTTRTTIEEVVG